MVPSKYSVVKNIPIHEWAETPHKAENLLQDPWFDQGSGPTSSGRGRGVRSRGRGRTRGGKSQRKAVGPRSASGRRSVPVNSERFGQLLGWKGRTRGRGGRKRGRRTVANRQKAVKGVVEIAGQKDKQKEVVFEKMERSSSQEWTREEATRMQVDDAENATSSSSERSEYDDDNGPSFGNEYDDLVENDYSGVFIGKSDQLLDNVNYNEDGEEDDEEHVEEGDDVDEYEDEDDEVEGEEEEEEEEEEDGDGDGDDIDVDGYINGDFDGEGNRYNGEEPLENPDSTSSSDYSD